MTDEEMRELLVANDVERTALVKRQTDLLAENQQLLAAFLANFPPPPEAVSSDVDVQAHRRFVLAASALPAVIEVFDRHHPDAASHENFAKEAWAIADAVLAGAVA